MTRKYCTSCGSPRQEGRRFCTSCGAEFTEDAPQKPAETVQPQPQSPAQQGSTQQPAPTPQYAPVQPPLQSRKRSKLPAVLGIGCGLTMLLVGVVFIGILLFGGGDGTTGGGSEFVRYDLSAGQQRVVEEFGLPRTFTIVYGEDVEGALDGGDLDTHRVECWDYYEMGTRFVFRDGKVVGTRDIDSLGDGVAYPAISPRQFIRGMTVDEVTESMGVEPAASGQLTEEIAPGVEVYVWDGLLACTFENGGLIAAETAPLVGEVAQ